MPTPAATMIEDIPLMQLHWSPKSPYVRKVMICAGELGLLDRIKLRRSVAAMLQPSEDIMRDNPLSKIPTLVFEDGATLFDSVVICEYLDTLAGGNRLFPTAPDRKWQALRWHALGDGLLDALILWRNERERDVPLDRLVEAFDIKTRAALTVLDGEVEQLAQAPFSIGHITIACALGYIDYRFVALGWRGLAPRLQVWYDELRQRPSLAETEPRDG